MVHRPLEWTTSQCIFLFRVYHPSIRIVRRLIHFTCFGLNTSLENYEDSLLSLSFFLLEVQDSGFEPDPLCFQSKHGTNVLNFTYSDVS